jgi:hypothetical protein
MSRMRPKPHATPDDLAFGINACAMALEAGVASRCSSGETKNDRVLNWWNAKAAVVVTGVDLTGWTS